YCQTASGANTTRTPPIHSSAGTTLVSKVPPSINERTPLMTADTGWFLTNGWSQLGIVATRTNADDAKTSGAMTGNDAAWAASGSPTARPTAANTHDSA